MSLAPTSELVAAATADESAALAFNVITIEHVEAVVAAAQSCGVPVIIQISENAVRFREVRVKPIAQAALAIAESVAVPVALHLDHVTDFELLRCAADNGFSSAMFDSAALAYADNVAATHRAARWAQAAGIWLEAELGYVGGKPGASQSAHAAGVRTDPGEAADYVAATGVDALAVAVGSSHAMTTRTAVLDIALIRDIAAAVPVPLVLHGSSGVPDDQLRAAATAGIRKINVGTALNAAFTTAVRDALALDATGVDPRKYLASARAAMARAAGELLTSITA
jgi:fructose-bisphosphate aldolase class II